jgi:hypothetical protein
MALNADGLLKDARVYLSGPMDFVASRQEERASGWRTRVSQFLREMGVVVFDPWEKPEVRGLHEYGKEEEGTTNIRATWTFEQTPDGPARRSAVAESFWPALHIDLRMVDTSDFVICYCPTNVYSVGTPHEIVLARQQRKPVLFVSPYVRFSAYDELARHLDARGDTEGKALLETLKAQVPIKENPNASPSLWYLPLIGGEHFFDGFGFDEHPRFKWSETDLDRNERRQTIHHPLLKFLESLNAKLPEKWDRRLKKMVPNDDWLLWDLKKGAGSGGTVEDTKGKTPRS